VKAGLQWNIVPAKNLPRTQVVEGREGIQFVEARHYAAIFNVRQPADVENKVWAPPPCCEFIAGALYVSIG